MSYIKTMILENNTTAAFLMVSVGILLMLGTLILL